MTGERDAVTGLRWIQIRPESGRLRDLFPTGPLLRPFDVVALNLLSPNPQAPYTERWIVGLPEDGLQIRRRLGGARLRRFLGAHTDRAPHQVLDKQERSLCLIEPTWIQGTFRLDPTSGRFDARIAFGLERRTYRGPFARGGFVVADPNWMALGRSWLPRAGGWTEFDGGDLEARLGIEALYLVVGLARAAGSVLEPTLLAVHTVPDYLADGRHSAQTA
jgi:hypothetical protein